MSRSAREEEDGDPVAAFARLLAQRAEVGFPDLILGRMDRAEALDAAEDIRHGASEARVEHGGNAPELGSSGPPPEPSIGEARPKAAEAERAESSGTTTGLPADHEGLKSVASGCVGCRLSQGRSQVVFHDGNPSGRLMVVGEAPGAEEDRTGVPFVGRAGKLLDLLLASVGLSRRHSVYICNVIKCRPPGNRDPRPDEIETCSPYLRRQIELVRPDALLAVGTFAGKLLSGEDRPLGQLRGEVHSYEGVPLVVTYHPAALLRNPGWTRATWEDLQLLLQVLDAPEAA